MARQIAPKMTDEDWRNLEHEVIQSFTPGTPINEAELLAGRGEITRQLQNTVLEPGRHALIYGERGVGKTSIANTFYRSLIKPTRNILPLRVNGDTSDTFETLWRKVFRRIKVTLSDGREAWATDTHPEPLTADDVVTELSSFSADYCPIIVLDEFDRIEDQKCKSLISDIIKNLSDYTANCTVVIVGVAKSVTELISNHASVERALVQVHMRRLSRHELADIVTLRLLRLGMAIEDAALWRITFFSFGLPFYTHSLGKHASLRAIAEKRKKIIEADVFNAMQDCLSDVDYSVKESYVRGTEKIYRKKNVFAEVLAACSLTEIDSLGQFSAVAVEKPFSEIVGERTKSSSFGFHLNELSRPERGLILDKSGERRTYKFQFRNPLMQPYIIMRSIQENLITRDLLAQRMLKPQMELSIEPSQPS